MSAENLPKLLRSHWVYFTLGLVITLTLFTLYGFNMIRWRNSPDFGWRTMYDSGPNSVAEIFERGESAGLRAGDNIVAINGRKYGTFDDLFFNIRRQESGSVNTYTVSRDGKEIDIAITTGRLGFRTVLWRSGMLFLCGLAYFLIGTLVYLMKPGARESWLFFVMTALLGSRICWAAPSDLFYPLWLFDLRNLFSMFFPAALLHLLVVFPKSYAFVSKRPWLLFIPYILAVVIFVLMQVTSTAYWNIPPTLTLIYNLYVMLAILLFMASIIRNLIRESSVMIRLQSQVIFIGIILGFFVPAGDLVVRSYLNVYLFPDPVIGFMVFLTAFPLSIGFTIVKYDLFAIDTVIKRTYGYMLTTGAIIGIYAVVATISNLAFGRLEIAKSPVFPAVFILLVVFFFNPLRNRVQRFIDRLFYRLEYDYQETVQKISETMRTLLGLDEIGKSIMKFALGSMFIDVGTVILLNREKNEYECLIRAGHREDTRSKTGDRTIVSDEKRATAEDEKAPHQDSSEIGEPDHETQELKWPADDPLIQKIAERKKEVTIYDIQGDPFFEAQRDVYEKAFDQLGATLVIPLIYEDRLTGLITLGQKKSGKFYRRDDVNLLNILANQAAVAIKNADMLEEIIEKERMRTKIMDAFGKYVTHEVRDLILEGRIPLDGESKDVTVLFADLRGFTTLAESTPPKEVVKIINGYFSEMAEAIGQNHGLVLQFIGDEIEAVFGAPLNLEEHPTHAVRAAMAMRERLVSVNEKLQKKGYDPLRHGIGIHTGNVVAANIGSDDRLSYALVGDTVNMASRIQGLNKEFGTDILISATTLERVTEYIDGEKLPATTVKGKKEPVEIFKLN